MKTKSKLSFFTDKPYLIWAILFIIAPLLMVAYYALTDKTGAFSLASVEQIPTYITTFCFIRCLCNCDLPFIRLSFRLYFFKSTCEISKICSFTRNASYVDELSYQNLQLDDYFG